MEVDVSQARLRILRALENQDTSVAFDDPLESEMVLNMGPQHPATHGVLRLLVRLDGESIVSVIPDLGYLHRGYEKLAENCTFHEFIPHTDRLDYLSPLANNVAYVLAVEKLAGIDTEQVYLTSGTYHRLADMIQLGWHPRFRELMREFTKIE